MMSVLRGRRETRRRPAAFTASEDADSIEIIDCASSQRKRELDTSAERHGKRFGNPRAPAALARVDGALARAAGSPQHDRCLRDDGVAAGPTVEHVLPPAADEHVVPGLAPEGVDARAADQDVVAV